MGSCQIGRPIASGNSLQGGRITDRTVSRTVAGRQLKTAIRGGHDTREEISFPIDSLVIGIQAEITVSLQGE